MNIIMILIHLIIIYIFMLNLKTLLRYLLPILLIILPHANTQEYQKTQINQNWNMTIVKGPPQAENLKSKTFKTSIPTNVHLDLQAAGQIPNPLLKENYPTVKWVSEANYLYSTNFQVDSKIFNHAYHKLTFQGIDTYAEVYLNGQKIIETQNAYRQYSHYVQGILKQGTNKLEVKINSTIQADRKGQRQNSMPFEYAHTRKACYQYSWDWAPYLNTIGVWKTVFLESFNQIKLDYVWIRTRSITQEKALVNFAIALQLPAKELADDYEFVILQDGQSVATFTAKERYTYFDVKVPNPKLWWPNGIGQPFIYEYTVQLFKKDLKTKVDERRYPFGIRTVTLNQKDKKFQVMVNGYPIYCKGANWVPPDMFYSRLENSAYKPANTIQSLLQDVQNSNFNMIRVWGGGQYESNKFLQLASRRGIMLFYDFMFSDSIYPSTQKFLLNVEQQIKQQIRRARNYPALALWSGNNEILQGINDWGWGRQNYRDDYHKLFQVLIPKIIQYQSPYISYIPSSPVFGVGNYGFDRGGDVHYWAVWAASGAFQSYQGAIGKFNSQFGTQALPVWETIIEGISANPSYQDNAVNLHERHNSRFNTLRGYMNQYMKKALNFELQTYQSGLLQAFAIELAIKAQRAAKPNSAGTLYWQLNDAWPSISWSSIDYYGRWKPLQFMAKRLYPDVAIITTKKSVYTVNDKLYPVKALALIKFFHLNGTLLSSIEKEVDLKENQVKMIHPIQADDYKGSKVDECMIYTEIIPGKNLKMSSTFFNTKFQSIKLYPAEIQIQHFSQFNTMVISAKTAVVKNLFISRKSKYLKVSDNYFDLVPGHPVKVQVLNGETLDQIKNDLMFRSYRQVDSADSSVKVTTKASTSDSA